MPIEMTPIPLRFQLVTYVRIGQTSRHYREAGVPYLLFRPLVRRMIGYIQVYHLLTGNLHDDEHIKDLKRDRVLQKSHKTTWP